MKPLALSLLLFAASARAADAPGAAAAVTQKGEQWRAKLDALNSQSSTPPAVDLKACDECLQAQDLVDACQAVKIDDLLPKTETPHECAGNGGACEVTTAAVSSLEICKRRGGDAKCKEAMSPEKTKGLDSFIVGMLKRCGPCYKDREDWRIKRKAVLSSREKLDAALGRQDVTAVTEAVAEAESQEKCGWTCGVSSSR